MYKKMADETLTIGKTSKFNEAILKMQRIDRCQGIVSMLKTNLLSYDATAGKYHYEIVISELLNLCQEAKGKLSDKEKVIANNFRDILTIRLELSPVFKEKKTSTLAGMKTRKQLNEINWKVIQGLIFSLEDFVAQILEEHGLTSTNLEQEELWD